MNDLGAQFEAFRYWLGELWTTRPWLGALLVLSVASVPVAIAWLGKLRRQAASRRLMQEEDEL